jgi:hypothetical protein
MKNSAVRTSFFSLLMVLACMSSARTQPLTNEQIVVNTVRQQINQNIEKDSASALLVISSEKELDLLIAGAIADAMRTKYPQVLLASSPSPNANNLAFDIQGFDFSFHKGASRGFLKAHKIKRQLQAQLRITIRSGMDGQLREVRDFSVAYDDIIDPAWAKFVNSRNIPELAPPVPSSGWSRYVEPTLVISAVGTLVYLFFANR